MKLVLFLLAKNIVFVFCMSMQVTNIQPNIYNQNNLRRNNNSQNFGQYVSKLGRSIDDVLRVEEPSAKRLTALYDELVDFVRSPKFLSKQKGEGHFSHVYNIDDKYVFKVAKHSYVEPDRNIEVREPLFPQLKTYYGDTLLISGNLKILKNVSSNNKHTVVGVPPEIIKENPMPCISKGGRSVYGMVFADYQYGNKILKYYNEEYLPTFSALPQASFDKVAKDLAFLNKKGFDSYGFSIDTNNPNNIVLVGKSSLRIVDDISVVGKRKPNSVAGLLNMFLVKASHNIELPLPTNDSSKLLRFKLLKKIILAGEKYDLPLVCYNVQDENIWLHSCYGLKETGWSILENLQKMRDNIPDKKQRFVEIENYINMLGEDLERNSNQQNI